MDIELEELQTELSTAYTNFSQVIRKLESDKHSQSGVSGDWSPKDVLSHLIGWDKSLQGFITDPDEFNPAPLYDINTFNAKSVSERQHQSWEETLNELESSNIDLPAKGNSNRNSRDEDIRPCEWLAEGKKRRL